MKSLGWLEFAAELGDRGPENLWMQFCRTGSLETRMRLIRRYYLGTATGQTAMNHIQKLLRSRGSAILPAATSIKHIADPPLRVGFCGGYSMATLE
jgi:hypothetical protein